MHVPLQPPTYKQYLTCFFDLQPENILCVSQNESPDIKLVDFGLARDLKAGNEVKSSFGTPDFVGKYFLLSS